MRNMDREEEAIEDRGGCKAAKAESSKHRDLGILDPEEGFGK